MYIGTSGYRNDGEWWSWLSTRGRQKPMLTNLDSSLICAEDIVQMGGFVLWVGDFDLCIDARRVETLMQVY